MSSTDKASLFSSLASSGFTVVAEKESASGNQLVLMGRCPTERWNFWLLVISTLLEAADDPKHPWTCDISKKYVRSNGRVFYGWRLIFQGENIAAYYAPIAGVINSSPRPARVELAEQLLPGAKPGQLRGGVNAKGKGASVGGSVPLILSSQASRKGLA